MRSSAAGAKKSQNRLRQERGHGIGMSLNQEQSDKAGVISQLDQLALVESIDLVDRRTIHLHLVLSSANDSN